MIGVFDSGYGGLSVLKEFVKLLPEHDYYYLGDNARNPYGNKSDEVIYENTRQAVDFLFGQGCQLIILACHTASAKALRRLQQEYLPSRTDNKEKRILGVIVPTIEEALSISGNKRIGIIGTKATINSKVYEIELAKREDGCQVFSQACPLLVPFIEENWQTRPEFKRVLKKYLQPLKIRRIDVLILGCTHYALALEQIKSAIGRRVNIIDPAITAAVKLKDYLERHPDIDSQLSKKGKIILTTTDDARQLKDIGQKIIEGNIEEVKKIELK